MKLKHPLKIVSQNSIQKRPKFCLAVAAGKGGVGKSTVAVNLALALKKQGLSIGLLDADIYGPSIVKMLPIETLPKTKEDQSETLIPGESLGIKIISSGHLEGIGASAVVRAPIATRIISQFINQVEWGDLDFLIVDFPPGTGDIQITLLQEGIINGGLIVTMPQEVALLDVCKTVDMFLKMQVPLLGIVENMSYFLNPKTGEKHLIFGSCGGQKLSAFYSLPLFGEIPIDPEIAKSGDEGKSLFEMVPDSSVVEIFTQIGHKVREKIGALIQLSSQCQMHFEISWKNPWVETDDLAIIEDELKNLKNIAVCEGSFFIRKIFQNGLHSFIIIWHDGSVHEFSLTEVQKNCPCMRCQKQKKVDPFVTAIWIKNMGIYALKIAFTSGCSNGVYSFALLRSIK
ncbi:MAG: P-loop NTPase [Chlamydiae bacterium]|nr:P-loop NTPase [Chlamydiota bacterium]